MADVTNQDRVKWAMAAVQTFADVTGLDTASVPGFSGDPRGAVLKIRVPDGFSNSFGDEGIVVPS